MAIVLIFRSATSSISKWHFVFVCNRSQPSVFFLVFMPLYPTDSKQGKEYERTTETSPNVRILVPAVGDFVP